MNTQLLVTKRSGVKEPLNLDKIHRVVTWAAEVVFKIETF